MFGATPLDICLGIYSLQVKDSDSGIFTKSEEALKEIKGYENIAMADVIFEHLSNYSFMQSSF
jgi:hypothetical protein